MKKPGETKYPHIFQTGQLGKLEVKNRIKYAATETNFNHRDGFVSDREVNYMEDIAKGGPGIVTAQGAYTDSASAGKGYVGMMAIYDDKFIPGLGRIAKAIKKHDSVAILQLMHCGRVGGVELEYTVGPSDVPQRLSRFRPPREMSKEDIKQEVQNHIDGARRAIEAGFDGIEVSGIVGYLVSNFNSKYTNKRTDEYGGSVEGRARFMCEILRGIRNEIGKDYPLIVRLCGEELLDDRGGSTPEECMETWKLAEACDIDLLSVTAGWQESPVSVITRDIPMGSWLHVVERAKKAVKCQVCMAYRLRKPEYPDRAIAEGKLDYWEMCRPMIAEPHLPLKILEGREEDVIPCMSCNLCLARLFRDQPIVCMVNPRLGHYYEPEWEVSPAPQKKRVVVVGGGVAGMQCAAVAAQQGHDVTLYDKNERLGGQLCSAAKGPYGDDEFQEFIDYLASQCKKSGVKIVLNHEVTDKQFADPLHNPDAIVIATGARAVPPSVPGADRSNVVTAHDAMDGKVEVGERCLIIGGRGVGIGVALFLAANGKQVSIVEGGKKLGRDVNPSYIWRYVRMLKGHKVQMFTQSKVEAISDEGVTVVGPDGQKTVVPVDTVVLGTMQSNKELVEPLEFACGELYTIGDASTPRRAHNAALEGYRTGLRI